VLSPGVVVEEGADLKHCIVNRNTVVPAGTFFHPKNVEIFDNPKPDREGAK
jgi:ADP-glucose pyrophosphorylase